MEGEPLPLEVESPRALRVLIIDDEKAGRIRLRRLLRAATPSPVDVEEGETCAAAIERIRSGELDCVFLDDVLPDGTGLEVLRAVRNAGARTPIVVLTGQRDEVLAVEMMKAGATDYLPKRLVTTERLGQAVRSAMRVARAEQHAARAERERERALLQERLARDEAEAAQRRLAFLAEASAHVSTSLDYHTTLENVARLAVPSLADWCLVDLLEPDDSYTRMAVAHKDPGKDELARRLRRRYDGMPGVSFGVSRVIATGRSEVMEEVPPWVWITLARDADHLEAMIAMGARSIMCVPLTARGRTLGAMTFILSSPHVPYTSDDLAFAEEVARRAALAVDNARLFNEVKLAEERLRHQLDFTTAITGSLAEGVCALDAGGRVTFANTAAQSILGWSAEELLGRDIHETIHDGTGCEPGTCDLLRGLLAGRVLRDDDATFRRADARSVPVGFVASPIVSAGQIVGAVLAFHDITRRKRAQEELEESRRTLAQNEKLSALGTLVSGVAHELRTPLTYLTNNIFLMQARLEAAAREDSSLAPLVEETRRFGTAAMEGVDRINVLVKDLRPFANPEAGRRIVAGLHEVVGGAVDLFRATQRGRVDVVADLGATPSAMLDRGQLQRVVINLLVNASEAMPHGGRIHVATSSVGDHAILEVVDEGPGIPPHVEARMFDPFYTTKPDGTGLGLSITRRIVEAHGGSIRYRTQPGVGTAFIIELPTGTDDLSIPVDSPMTLVPIQ